MRKDRESNVTDEPSKDVDRGVESEATEQQTGSRADGQTDRQCRQDNPGHSLSPPPFQHKFQVALDIITSPISDLIFVVCQYYGTIIHMSSPPSPDRLLSPRDRAF